MNDSRGTLRAVLEPGQWVTLCQLEDPYGDPAFTFHQLHAIISADPLNTTAVSVEVHESENGTNWRRTPVSTTVVPGGRVSVTVDHVLRWIRIVLYSVSTGIVYGTKITAEPQVLPGFISSPVVVEEAVPTVIVEVPEAPQQCKVGYSFEAILNWEPVEYCEVWWRGDWPWDKSWYPGDACGVWCKLFYPNLDLYVRSSAGVVYFDNLVSADLVLNHDAYPFDESLPAPPEIVTGTFTESSTFYVWYSQRSKNAPAATPTLKQVTITNTGTCVILVNSVPLAAGETYTLDDFMYAGYDTGDMYLWLGGTPVAV